jgi:hypothetical protein
VLAFAWLLGCPPPPAAESPPVEPGAESQPSDTDEPTDPATTYYRDVRPLLASSCAQCHQPQGLGPGDFLDYEAASAWAEVMVDRIDAGEMPPPAADPECHPYEGMEHMRADPALRDTLAAWIELGKPAGDEASAPAVQPYSPPPLSRRDVELRASAPVVPQFVDSNEYRCFLLGEATTEPTFIAGVEFLNDHPEISHHALLFIDPDAGSESYVQDGPSRSWPCPSTQPAPEYQLIHAWAPAGGALEFPDDMGLALPAGAQLVVQMHYYEGAAQAPADQPGYALKLEPTVEEELYYVALGPEDFVIPAGDAHHTETFEIDMFWLTFGLFSVEVRGVLPHMHVLGTAYDFYATEPDGDQNCISRADDYDFAMQPTYWFEYPVEVAPDDTVTVTCSWDNSAGTDNVTFGENTQQEMCYALMYVTVK